MSLAATEDSRLSNIPPSAFVDDMELFELARIVGKVPLVVLNVNVSHGARNLLALLYGYTSIKGDSDWPPSNVLAEFLHVTERTIRNYFRELEARRLVIRQSVVKWPKLRRRSRRRRFMLPDG